MKTEYTKLSLTALINKIGNARFWDLPSMLKEVLTRQSPTYKEYSVLITQLNEEAPVAVSLNNTIGGTPVWSRIGSGAYRVTLSGLLTEGRVGVMHKSIIGTSPSYNLLSVVNANNSVDFLVEEGVMTTPELIQIRVYS